MRFRRSLATAVLVISLAGSAAAAPTDDTPRDHPRGFAGRIVQFLRTIVGMDDGRLSPPIP
jgi:hypothetical protein